MKVLLKCIFDSFHFLHRFWIIDFIYDVSIISHVIGFGIATDFNVYWSSIAAATAFKVCDGLSYLLFYNLFDGFMNNHIIMIIYCSIIFTDEIISDSRIKLIDAACFKFYSKNYSSLTWLNYPGMVLLRRKHISQGRELLTLHKLIKYL